MMLSLTFEEFSRGEYGEKTGNCYDDDSGLYVVKNCDDVLYVGISKTGIWNRWFGSRGRMAKFSDRWAGYDAIGIEIAEQMPASLQYTIELYSLDDLCELLKDEIKEKYAIDYYKELRHFLDDVEIMMIHKLRPALNVMHNNYQRNLRPVETEAAQRRAVFAAFGQGDPSDKPAEAYIKYDDD